MVFGDGLAHPARAPVNLRQLARNVSAQWLTLALQLALSLALTRFMVRRLGLEGTGVIALVSGVVGYSGVFYLGLGAAVVRFVAVHHADADRDALDETVSTIFTFYLGVGALWLALTVALAAPFPVFFRVPAACAWEARAMLVMVGAGFLVHFPGSVYGGVVMGLQRHDLLARVHLGLLLARAALTAAVLAWRPSVALLGAINAASLVAEPLAASVYARRLLPSLVVSPRRFSGARLRSLLTFSVQSFVFTVSEKLIGYTDHFVISHALGTGAVAVYDLPLRLTDYARDGVDRVSAALLPAAADAVARGDAASLAPLWRLGSKVVVGLVAPAALVLFVWGRHVLAAWVGPAVADAGAPALRWLSLALVAQVAGRALARPLYEALGELACPARVVLAEGVLNLALSVALVRAYGVAGVAFATFLPAALTGFVVMPWLVCRRLGLSWTAHVARTLGRTAPPLVPAWALLWAAEALGLHQHLATIALTCAAVLAVYLAGAAVVAFDPEERAALRRWRSA